ncbi:hypothetical protein ABW21_db0209222 [Orbilia brochopaga]|nr:hypothetical protein ABW21_db0209222 [Drechslerella brochopaga]
MELLPSNMLLYISLWILRTPIAAAVPHISNAYDIKRPPLRGGCTPDQIDQLDQWWQESAIMADDAYDQAGYLLRRDKDDDTVNRQRTSLSMLAAWYKIIAQDPYTNTEPPDGIHGVYSQPVNQDRYVDLLSAYSSRSPFYIHFNSILPRYAMDQLLAVYYLPGGNILMEFPERDATRSPYFQ